MKKEKIKINYITQMAYGIEVEFRGFEPLPNVMVTVESMGDNRKVIITKFPPKEVLLTEE